MTKKQLVKLIAEDMQLHHKQVDSIISNFLNAIKQNVCNGNKVEIPKFGIFEAVKHEEKKCRNPQTGEMMTIPSRFVPTFKPSKTFKEAVKAMEM